MTDTIVDIPGVGQVAFPAGMSDADIEGAIRSKILPAAGEKPSRTAEALKSAAEAVNTGINWAGTQFTKGLTGLAGLPRTAADLNQRSAEWLGEKAGLPATGRAIGQAARFVTPGSGMTPSADDFNRAIFKGLGVPEVNAGDVPALKIDGAFGKVNAGKILDAGMQAVPGMLALPVRGAAMLSPGAQAAAVGVPAMAGGGAAELAGQATEGSAWEIPARLVAGALGVLAGSKAVTPLPARLTPEQGRLVELAKAEGIPLTVGQETGRGRGIESALARFPTSQGRMAAFADEQNAAINQAALREAGATGERLDPTTMNRVMREASDAFNAARNASGNVKLDTNFYRSLDRTITTYLDNTPAAAQTPSVLKRASDFAAVPGRELTGEQYQEFRRTLNDAASAVSDVGARRALQGMRGALDDAMAASLPADQAAAWQEVRRNWSNLKILTKAAAGGSADSRASGNLSPSALSMALRQRQGADRFASTEGGLNDIARMAGYLADTRPNSGTPQTMATQSLITGTPLAGGYLAGGLGGAATAAGAMAIPNIAARAATGTGWMTPLGPMIPLPASAARGYLANQVVPTAFPELTQGYRSLPLSLVPGGMTAAPQLGRRQ